MSWLHPQCEIWLTGFICKICSATRCPCSFVAVRRAAGYARGSHGSSGSIFLSFFPESQQQTRPDKPSSQVEWQRASRTAVTFCCVRGCLHDTCILRFLSGGRHERTKSYSARWYHVIFLTSSDKSYKIRLTYNQTHGLLYTFFFPHLPVQSNIIDTL
jgi:hypothetical protein